MKPPPLFLVFLVLLFGDAESANCDSFPRDYVSVNRREIPNEKLVASYINHKEVKNKFILHCYKEGSGNNGEDYTAVIETLDEKHVATIVHLDCSSTQSLFKNSFMFVRIRETTFSRNKYLAVGIRTSSEWCRYDVCLNCVNPKSRSNLDIKPTEAFFRWSEPRIEVTSVDPKGVFPLEPTYSTPRKRYNLLDRYMIAQYLSFGEPKFVLHCYKVSDEYYSIIRTTMGQIITTVAGVDCSPGKQFIQTFYVVTSVENKGVKKSNIYQLATKPEDLDWVWYRGIGDEEHLKYKKFLYYFIGDSSSRNCFWREIKSGGINNCPSLPHSDIIEDKIIFNNIREYNRDSHLTAVAKYTNGGTPRFTLTCFKTGKDETLQYFSVITDSTGEYVLTIKNRDCSSKENFNSLFYVHTAHSDQDMSAIVVGSRFTPTDDWCWYYIYKPANNRLYRSYKWLYYDYKPITVAVPWKEVDSSSCPTLSKQNIVAGRETHFPDSKYFRLFKKYLWYNTNEKTDSLLLYCYTDNKNKVFISVILTLEEKIMTSINYLDCSSKSVLDQKTYMFGTKINQKNYLSIGTRPSAQDDWCRFDVCVDCENGEVQMNFNSNPRNHFHTFIEWSEAGIEWQGGPPTPIKDFNAKDVLKQYVIEGKTQFVLTCIKVSEEENQPFKGLFRTTSGTHIATIPFNFDCSTMKFKLKFFFLNKIASEKITLITYHECKEFKGCDLQLENKNQEKWFYYHIENLEYTNSDLQVKDRYKPNSCPAISGENIRTKKLDHDNGIEQVAKYWNGGNPKLIISCYKDKNTYYAVISTENDKYILTIENINCQNEKYIGGTLYVHTTSGDEDYTYIIIGSRYHTADSWCWYNVLNTEEQNHVWVYYDYQPDELALQWYKDDNSACDWMKKEDINFHSKASGNQETNTVTSTYVAQTGQGYLMLYCYENLSTDNKKYYTSIIKTPRGEHELELKGMDYSSQSSLNMFYMFGMKNAENKYLAIVDKSCRYDVCLSCVTPKVHVNIDGSTKPNNFRWSEPGISIESRPSFKDVFVPVDGNKNQLSDKSLVAEYYSNTDIFYIRFFIQCYKTTTDKKEEHHLVIRSANGLHLGTLTSKDCSKKENLPQNVYLHITKGTETVYSGDLRYSGNDNSEHKEWLCWYFGCKTPMNLPEQTKLFYIFSEKKTEWDDIWTHVTRDNPNSCPDLKREELSIVNTNVQERGALVAKYIMEDSSATDESSKYQFLCYQEENGNEIKYSFVVTDTKGQHVVTILNHDCSSNDGVPVTRLYVLKDKAYKGDAYDFVLVGSSNCLYSVCRNCETSHITVYPIAVSFNNYYWREVSIDTCPSVKREDIHMDESKIQLDETNLITSYITDNRRGAETIILYCYHTGETASNRKHISVLRTPEGTHIASIKGLDCSSRESLNKKSYISIKKDGVKKFIILGTRTVLEDKGQEKSIGPWCEYEICMKCETIKVNTERISTSHNYEWSEAGIKINNCPSLNHPPVDSAGNKLTSSRIVAEYVESMVDTSVSSPFVLDCYKLPGEDTSVKYFLNIRTSKGLHIVTIPTLDCSNYGNLIRQFYIYGENTKKQIELFEMGKPTTTLCWNIVNEISTAKNTLFYYFPSKDVSYARNLWRMVRDNSCPSLKKDDITTEIEDTKHENRQETAKYLNGGNPRFTLTCYKAGNTKGSYSFATVSDATGQHVLSIKSFDCSSVNQMLYIHTMNGNDDLSSIVVGSKNSQEWCWYSVFKKWESDNIWVNYNYKPLYFTSQWYEVDVKGCPAVEKDNIFTDEKERDLKHETLDSVYVIEVASKDDNAEETLLNYCYYTETGDKRSYYLVIRTPEGRYVASIKDFDCSSKSSTQISQAIYMFTFKGGENLNYLALGTSSDKGRTWCRYDICLDCGTKQIRQNIDTMMHYGKKFYWSEPGIKIDNCPSLKNQEIKYDVPNPISSYDTEAVYLDSRSRKFILECHQVTHGTASMKWNHRFSIIKTEKGRHITTIPGINCSSKRYLINLGYVLVKREDGTTSMLKPYDDAVKRQEDDSCWFYGCKTCKSQETLLFMFRKISKWTGNWDVVKHKQSKCPKFLERPRDRSTLESLQRTEGYLIAKYQNQDGFRVDCYQHKIPLRYTYTTVIAEPEGEHVVNIEGMDCSDVNELRKYFNVFFPRKIDNADDAKLVFISITLPYYAKDEFCSHIVCLDCEKQNSWVHYKMNNGYGCYWSKIPTETCPALSREQLVLTTDMNLNSQIATYLLEDEQQKNKFILACRKTFLYGKQTISTHLQTLRGKHIVLIKDLDCSSEEKVSETTYISAKRSEGKDYLLLGTRIVEDSVKTPWCIYNICISCETKDMTVNVIDYPDTLLPLKWSKPGIRLDGLKTSTGCSPTATKIENMISSYENTIHRRFSVDCHVPDTTRNTDYYYCSVIKRDGVQQSAIALLDCLPEDNLITNFYIYSLYKTKDFTLLTLDDSPDNNVADQSGVKETWFYYFVGDKNNRNKGWKLVTNPKTTSKDARTDPDCFPHGKKLEDLAPVGKGN